MSWSARLASAKHLSSTFLPSLVKDKCPNNEENSLPYSARQLHISGMMRGNTNSWYIGMSHKKRPVSSSLLLDMVTRNSHAASLSLWLDYMQVDT